MNPLLAHSIPPGAGRSWEQCPSCMARPHTGRGPFPEPLASTTQPLQDQATDCPDGLSQTQSPPSGLFPPKGVTGLLSPRPHPTSSPSRIGGGTPTPSQPHLRGRTQSAGPPLPLCPHQSISTETADPSHSLQCTWLLSGLLQEPAGLPQPILGWLCGLPRGAVCARWPFFLLPPALLQVRWPGSALSPPPPFPRGVCSVSLLLPTACLHHRRYIS